MRIAVITWFQDSNYGTVLQAVALQRALKSKGYDVSLINYTPRREITIDLKASIRKRANHKADVKCAQWYKKANKEGFAGKDEAFRRSITANCKMTPPVYSDAEFSQIAGNFDAYICGSDQVWNPYWLDGRYYLDFVPENKIRIAYAPSFGISKIPDDKKNKIKQYLDKFQAISVRETEGAKAVEEITGRKIKCVCDPVNLLTKDQWNEYAKAAPGIKKPYVFYYFLTYQPEHWHAVKRFAEKKGMRIAGIPVVGRQYYFYRSQKYSFASPEEFVKLISDASYVFTDSFHAASFSIILQKQFYVFERFPDDIQYSQNSRVNNLLRKTDLDFRRVKYRNSKINEQTDINYSIVSKKLDRWISDSEGYLLDALEAGNKASLSREILLPGNF
jgi:hypothetical protein